MPYAIALWYCLNLLTIADRKKERKKVSKEEGKKEGE